MFKKVTKLLGAIALTGWMGVANATLIFNFSYESQVGEVIGVIEGLQDVLSIQSATNVTIISIDNVAQRIEFIGPEYDVIKNRFSINTTGNLQIAQFKSFNDYIFDNRLIMSGRFTRLQYNGQVATSGMTKHSRRVSVPEPSTVILLSLGLAGLSFVRYRKQS